MQTFKPLDFLFTNDCLDLCSICGYKNELTFEHMPPKASGNTNPVNIIGLENITSLGGYMYGKYKRSPKGMGGYKLCQTCNKKTGSWYGQSYIELSNQINKVIHENIGKSNVQFICKVKPLNFLKQVVSLLLCSDQATGILREEVKKTNFILEKEEQKLSNKIFISMNITLQPTYGMKGHTSSWDSNNGFSCNIEFIHRPFYFRCAFDHKEISENSINLIEFKNYKYDEEIEVKFIVDLSKFRIKVVNK